MSDHANENTFIWHPLSPDCIVTVNKWSKGLTTSHLEVLKAARSAEESGTSSLWLISPSERLHTRVSVLLLKLLQEHWCTAAIQSAAFVVKQICVCERTESVCCAFQRQSSDSSQHIWLYLDVDHDLKWLYSRICILSHKQQESCKTPTMHHVII